jgi:hypothetical protein
VLFFFAIGIWGIQLPHDSIFRHGVSSEVFRLFVLPCTSSNSLSGLVAFFFTTSLRFLYSNWDKQTTAESISSGIYLASRANQAVGVLGEVVAQAL